MNKIVSSYASSPIYREALRETFHEKMDIENAKIVLDKIAKGGPKIKKGYGCQKNDER
jgi:Lhr-like helicase